MTRLKKDPKPSSHKDSNPTPPKRTASLVPPLTTPNDSQNGDTPSESADTKKLTHYEELTSDTNLEEPLTTFEKISSFFMSDTDHVADEDEPNESAEVKSDLVTSTEVEDPLVPQFSTVYTEEVEEEAESSLTDLTLSELSNLLAVVDDAKQESKPPGDDVGAKTEEESQVGVMAVEAQEVLTVGVGLIEKKEKGVMVGEQFTSQSEDVPEVKESVETTNDTPEISDQPDSNVSEEKTSELEEQDSIKPPPLPPPPPPILPRKKATPTPPPREVPISSKRLGLSSSSHRVERTVTKVTKLTSDEADLVELVNKILSVSDEVADVVKSLKREAGNYSRQASTSTPLTETPQEAAFAYVKAMKPLQFGEFLVLCLSL